MDSSEGETRYSEDVENDDSKYGDKDRYYLPTEVAVHNTPDDCWVSYLYGVYDLTELCKTWRNAREICPIIANAGKDISHWFDHSRGDIKHQVHRVTGALVPFCPHGPIPHVGITSSVLSWRPVDRCPWWLDDKYKKGKLTKNPRPCRIINTLTGCRAIISRSSCTRGFSNSMKYFELCRRFFGLTQTVKSKSMKVAVLGAGGRTGNALSFFLKHCSLIDELALYDVTPVCHVAMELNHVDTKCRVAAGLPGDEGLKSVLEDSKIVVITAGLPSSDGKDHNDILMTNAEILAHYILSIIKHSPRALVAVATSPINHLIPMAGELYKRYGIFDYNRLFGITTLDCVRANTFAAGILGFEPEYLVVPVIGGSCSRTRVPLFSQTQPCNEFTNEEISKLTHAVRMAEEEVTKEYKGRMGGPSLTMGFATARFCMSLCKAAAGYSLKRTGEHQNIILI
ncbi:malate dehydrogenase-like isoform X2 [Diachasmimorpha longicaudata]|uniref:malate dehydrogenase-like isoform X2 n=1 Tax=Diachasmimorpha longicaudata TaxID=58733 RepID=UPI0030B8817B